MKRLALLLAGAAFHAQAQLCEVRLDRLTPHLQELPKVLITAAEPPVSTGWTDQKGGLVSVGFKVQELLPSLWLRAHFEGGTLLGDGFVLYRSTRTTLRSEHRGIGVGLGTLYTHEPSGFAVEAGLTGRLWSYRLTSKVREQTMMTKEAWGRLGVRWTLPMGSVRPFLAASSEWLLTPGKSPDGTSPMGDFTYYFIAQGEGQHANRFQSLGVGVAF